MVTMTSRLLRICIILTNMYGAHLNVVPPPEPSGPAPAIQDLYPAQWQGGCGNDCLYDINMFCNHQDNWCYPCRMHCSDQNNRMCKKECPALIIVTRQSATTSQQPSTQPTTTDVPSTPESSTQASTQLMFPSPGRTSHPLKNDTATKVPQITSGKFDLNWLYGGMSFAGALVLLLIFVGLYVKFRPRFRHVICKENPSVMRAECTDPCHEKAPPIYRAKQDEITVDINGVVDDPLMAANV